LARRPERYQKDAGAPIYGRILVLVHQSYVPWLERGLATVRSRVSRRASATIRAAPAVVVVRMALCHTTSPISAAKTIDM
jgi:hypothetical protein